ncbi:hypothetical protein [Nocardiopsis sp. MG754419]|uniref:hypothetical protein n=1 Tax=Nocardiopsis sp. MG754419 TaxID=2259865 RepID=UPI001BA62E83|nr:hypothetical protein [Nocardiopsis sp. MG754419]MBR8743511.1 hypothetical protein [Nocardiopsis sp. MG754419]
MSMPLPLPFEQGTPRTTPQKVTPRQLLGVREAEWRPHLESVSLVSEAPFNQRQLDQAAQALGAVFTEEIGVYGRSDLHRWPACTAAVTVGVATSRYASGTFWPALWETTRVPAPRQRTDIWGTRFLRSLEILGVDPFPGMTFPYVDPILMHSGIPTYCLGDLFDLLLHRIAVEPGLDAHGFHLWAVSGRHRLKDLDMPAGRFISSGGDYALETVERCMHLLELLREDPDAAPSEVGLPRRFHAPAVSALERAAKRGALPRHLLSHSSRPRSTRPRLRLDPFVHGVHVVLPVLEDSANLDVFWEITTDDDTHTVPGGHRWGSGAAEQTVFAVPRPVRTVSVTPRGLGVREQLTLVDPDDPLLIFDDSGVLVGSDTALPPGPVWVLHPSATALELSEEVEELGSFDVPYGWEGWSLLRLGLARDARVGLVGCPEHRVRGRERPRLEMSDAIPGVTTQHGAPVHAERPTVVLPAPEGAPVPWHVEVRSAEEGRLLWRDRADSGEHVRLFQGEEPVVGSFTVSVRGPLGRGISRQITVAEGFGAHHEPNSRLIEAAGLAPARSRLSSPDGAEAEPALLAFPADTPALPATLRSGTSVLPVTVSPPHMSLLLTREHAPRRRTRPVRLDCETVADYGDLVVRLPEGGQGSPGPLHVLHGDDVVQQIEAGASLGSRTHRYPLGQMVDTAATKRHLRLVLAYGRDLVPVAVVRPRRLAVGASVHDRVVHLDGFPGIDDVSAAVYECGAPWRAPVVAPVNADGSIVLPERAAGPVRILLAVDDPWSVGDWPRWPDPDDPNAVGCGLPGRPEGADAGEESLCAAFSDGSGLAELPLTHDNAVRLWRVLGGRRVLLRSGVPVHLLEACATALSRSPVAALLAHGAAEPAPDESVRSLVSGGIATVAAGGRVPATQAAELWHRLPSAAALATSDLLPLIDPDSPSPEHTELLEQLEQRCGPIAAALLRGEADPARRSGLFDAATEQLALMPEEQITAIWREARVVPRALLDEDSRTQAALGLFRARNQAELHRVRREAADISQSVLSTAGKLSSAYRRPVIELLEPRHTVGASRWRNLPAASLAMALTARLAARSVPAFVSLSRAHQPLWGDLARSAPDLVRIDIVLAELALAGAERAHLAQRRARGPRPGEGLFRTA